jgi:hypothetical protein
MVSGVSDHTVLIVILAVLMMALGGAVIFVFSRMKTGGEAWWKFRGTRVITCPETTTHAAVEVSAARAALTALWGDPHLRLRACSRWPERSDCGQDCLEQIESSPEQCLLIRILSDWYRERSCAVCKKPFHELHWWDHRPGLLTPDRRFVELHQIPSERLPDALDTHLPVCWNCLITESFRHQFPDLVVDRDWKKSKEPADRPASSELHNR